MTTVQNAMVMQDKFTAVMRGMISVTNNMISSMERVDIATNKAASTGEWTRLRAELNNVNNMMNAVDRGILQIPPHQKQVTRGFESWQGALVTINSAIGLIRSGIAGITRLTDTIDTNTSNTARLGLLTKSAAETKALQGQIFQASQESRGSYNDMQATVAKMGLLAGKNFSNTSEIVKFTETMNKAFVVSGAGATEQASAMYQLTQAMASGRLQGDEYRSIIENAPMLANAIEEYMINVKGATGSMKEWAADGLLTADVIKAALFNAADDINEKFKEMPMTFAQIRQSAVNQFMYAAQPLMAKLTAIVQGPGFKKAIDLLVSALIKLLDVLSGIVDFAIEHRGFIYAIIATLIFMIGTKLVFAINAAIIAMQTFNAVCKANIILLIASAIAWLVMKLIDLYNTSERFNLWVNKIVSGFQTVIDIVVYLINSVKELFSLLNGASFDDIKANIQADFNNNVIQKKWDHIAESYLKNWSKFSTLDDGSQYQYTQDDVRKAVTQFQTLMKGKKGTPEEWASAAELVKKAVFNPALESANRKLAEETSYQTGLLESVSEDTSALAKEVDISKESLAYLVDGITGKYINNINLSSPAPIVTVNMNGNITNGMDADQLIQQISDGVIEANSAGVDKAYNFG